MLEVRQFNIRIKSALHLEGTTIIHNPMPPPSNPILR